MKPRQRAFGMRILLLALVTLAAAPLDSAEVRKILEEIYPLPSTTGSEHLLAEGIAALLPQGLEMEKEGLGGFAVRLGRGEPRLMVLAPLDDVGFVVGGITEDGYLTLDRPVPAPHSSFDGFLLGNAVVVSTRGGIIHGVVAQPSMHLLNQERRKLLVDDFGLDNAYVDIGTRSAGEARERGVELLDAVSFRPDLVELASGRLSGPSLGVKALCAVLARVASDLQGFRPRGEILLVFAAQTRFTARGRGPRPSLGGLRAKNTWQPARTIVLGRAEFPSGSIEETLGGGPILACPGPSAPPFFQDVLGAATKSGQRIQTGFEADSPLLRAFTEPGREVVSLAVPMLFADTPGETVAIGDLEALARLLASILREGGRG